MRSAKDFHEKSSVNSDSLQILTVLRDDSDRYVALGSTSGWLKKTSTLMTRPPNCTTAVWPLSSFTSSSPRPDSRSGGTSTSSICTAAPAPASHSVE